MARANDENVLNTTVIMHNLIIDICENSSPEKGICLSPKFLGQLNEIKKFNYQHIYNNERLIPFVEYSELVIRQIFRVLRSTYKENDFWTAIEAKERYYPKLMRSFKKWLATYCDSKIIPLGDLREVAAQCENRKIYGSVNTEEEYIQAIIDFISGMTDQFAVKIFNELISYDTM